MIQLASKTASATATAARFPFSADPSAEAAAAREDRRLLATIASRRADLTPGHRQRTAAHPADALGRLFDHHGSAVHGLLERMLGRCGEAEEVLQEVFLWVWEHADRYDATRSSVRGWLLVIARSRALDVLRSDKSRRAREMGVERERPRCYEPAPLAGIEETERRRRLMTALEVLPLEQRQCIELAFFGGLSHTQIASKLGQPLGTVKSRIQLGMAKLRGALQSVGISGAALQPVG